MAFEDGRGGGLSSDPHPSHPFHLSLFVLQGMCFLETKSPSFIFILINWRR